MAAKRTVLCGVDGSEHATRAARPAGALVEPLGAELVLVHVTAGPVRRPLPLAYHQAPLDARRAARTAQLLAETVERAGLDAPRMRRVEARQATTGLSPPPSSSGPP